MAPETAFEACFKALPRYSLGCPEFEKFGMDCLSCHPRYSLGCLRGIPLQGRLICQNPQKARI